MKKKNNLFVFFCKMVFLTVIVMFLSSLVPMILTSSVMNFKYGIDFIGEFFMALVILLVMLAFKNHYVFTEKKEKFWKSILIGAPILSIALVIFIGNALDVGKDANLFTVLNLVLFTFTIGVAEEFMCRGWIQNEFIERFGKNRKQVITSICLSGLVFGFLHLTNVFAGQTLFETIMQVLQTTSVGILLGAIYFRTKNIWSVVALHGFYDFAIMIGEVNSLRDCSAASVVATSAKVYDTVTSILLVLFYLLSAFIILRKSKVNSLVEEKEKVTAVDIKKETKTNRVVGAILAVLLLVVFLPLEPDNYEDSYVCYEYDKVEINEYVTHYSHKDEYVMRVIEDNFDNSQTIHEYILFTDEETGKVGIKDVALNEVTYVSSDNIYGYTVIENEETYNILMFGDEDTYGSVVYYGIIQKDEAISPNYVSEKIDKIEEYMLPVVTDIGYLTKEDSNYNYPLIYSNVGDKFIIDETGSLYVLK